MPAQTEPPLINPAAKAVQDTITSAVQAAAVNDLPIIQQFVDTETPLIETIVADFIALSGQMGSMARANQVTAIQGQIQSTLTALQELLAATTDAQTAVPVV